MRDEFNEDKQKRGTKHNMLVPVVSKSGKPLMPTCASRARKLLDRGEAVARRSKVTNQFYIQLKKKTSKYLQEVVVAVDPGAKVDGFAVGSEKQTFIEAEVIVQNNVSKRVEDRALFRRMRRKRLRRRPARYRNRSRKGYIAPSQVSKVAQRETLLRVFCSLYPVKKCVLEDVRAESHTKTDARDKKHARKIRNWNQCFSTVMIGKTRFREFITGTLKLKLLEVGGSQTTCARKITVTAKSGNKWEAGAHSCDAYAMLCLAFSNEKKSRSKTSMLPILKREAPLVRLLKYRPERRVLQSTQLKPGGVLIRKTGTILIPGRLRKGDLVSCGLKIPVKPKGFRIRVVSGIATGRYLKPTGELKQILISRLSRFPSGKQPKEIQNQKISLTRMTRHKLDKWFRAVLQ